MPSETDRRREHALAIWRAGVAAVAPGKLIRSAVQVDGGDLVVGPVRVPLGPVGRIAVVGAGKAGAGMVRGLEEVLGDELARAKRLHGLVAVPDWAADDTGRVTLIGTRASRENRPTEAGSGFHRG